MLRFFSSSFIVILSTFTISTFWVYDSSAERMSKEEWQGYQRGVAVLKTEQGNEVISRGASVFSFPTPGKHDVGQRERADSEMTAITAAAQTDRVQRLYRKFLAEGRYSKVKSILQVDRKKVEGPVTTKKVADASKKRSKVLRGKKLTDLVEFRSLRAKFKESSLRAQDGTQGVDASQAFAPANDISQIASAR